MLFSYQTGYIMWHSRLMIYIPFGAFPEAQSKGIYFIGSLNSCNRCNYPRKKLFNANGTNYGSYWTQICLVSCSISTCFIKGKTSSVRGEQPSQLFSIMPPHSTYRLQLMPPTQNSSSSTLWWNTLIYCNWRGRFVSSNCHNLCHWHWTVSSEDSCTCCTNWVNQWKCV
jgi:hypothetical protein